MLLLDFCALCKFIDYKRKIAWEDVPLSTQELLNARHTAAFLLRLEEFHKIQEYFSYILKQGPEFVSLVFSYTHQYLTGEVDLLTETNKNSAQGEYKRYLDNLYKAKETNGLILLDLNTFGLPGRIHIYLALAFLSHSEFNAGANRWREGAVAISFYDKSKSILAGEPFIHEKLSTKYPVVPTFFITQGTVTMNHRVSIHDYLATPEALPDSIGIAIQYKAYENFLVLS